MRDMEPPCNDLIGEILKEHENTDRKFKKSKKLLGIDYSIPLLL
jgi:hypothetical protein